MRLATAAEAIVLVGFVLMPKVSLWVMSGAYPVAGRNDERRGFR